MTSCVKDSQLRAFVDSELPELEMLAMRAHAANCESCAQRLQGIAAASAEVKSLMNALAPAIAEPILAPEIFSAAEWKSWPGVSWISAVSALLVGAIGLLAFIHAQHGATPVREHTGTVLSNLPIRVPLGGSSTTLTVEVSGHLAGDKKHSSRRTLMTFVRVDGGEPIEAGTIVRVKLPAAMFSDVNPVKTPEVAADAVVDELGRVRAIRVLGSDGSDKE